MEDDDVFSAMTNYYYGETNKKLVSYFIYCVIIANFTTLPSSELNFEQKTTRKPGTSVIAE